MENGNGNGHDPDYFVNEESDRYESNTDEGYVKLSRSFVTSSLFNQDPNVVLLALYLITRANWKRGKFYCKYSKKEIYVERGQIITSITSLAERLPRFSRGKVRRALQKLFYSGFITDRTPAVAKSANGYLLLSIEKYTTYQDSQNYGGQRTHNERTTIEQRSDTIEEGKKERSNTLRADARSAPFKVPYSEKFEIFWRNYPKRVEKMKAYLAWKKAGAEKIPIDNILTGVERYKNTDEVQRGFIQYPERWIKAFRWEDETGVDDNKPQLDYW